MCTHMKDTHLPTYPHLSHPSLSLPVCLPTHLPIVEDVIVHKVMHVEARLLPDTGQHQRRGIIRLEMVA